MANHSSHQTPAPSIGWRYTAFDEARIKVAIIHAQRYMRNYGKGIRLAPINLRHYAQQQAQVCPPEE